MRKKLFLTMITLAMLACGMLSGADGPVRNGGTGTENTEESSDKAAVSTDVSTETVSEITETVMAEEPASEEPASEETYSGVTTVKMSFAGDCTLGSGLGYENVEGSFYSEYEKNGTAYFFENVQDIFANDDLTIVNLEGPLTTATAHPEKEFTFKGPYEYADILTDGSIEVVSLANNHTQDYYEQGMTDTKMILDEKGVGYFGYETSCIKEVNGVKIGFLGYQTINVDMYGESGRATVKNAIEALKSEGADAIVVYYHWGIETEYYANDKQRSLGKYSIDCGADLVIGSHPHVVQGIEEYNGKQIVYSLGNFCFGGNRNPSDKDCIIYSVTFEFTDGEITAESHEIIPCSISSVSHRNNFQPTILEGEDRERVLEKVETYSY